MNWRQSCCTHNTLSTLNNWTLDGHSWTETMESMELISIIGIERCWTIRQFIYYKFDKLRARARVVFRHNSKWTSIFYSNWSNLMAHATNETRLYWDSRSRSRLMMCEYAYAIWSILLLFLHLHNPETYKKNWTRITSSPYHTHTHIIHCVDCCMRLFVRHIWFVFGIEQWSIRALASASSASNTMSIRR